MLQTGSATLENPQVSELIREIDLTLEDCQGQVSERFAAVYPDEAPFLIILDESAEGDDAGEASMTKSLDVEKLRLKFFRRGVAVKESTETPAPHDDKATADAATLRLLEQKYLKLARMARQAGVKV